MKVCWLVLISVALLLFNGCGEGNERSVDLSIDLQDESIQQIYSAQYARNSTALYPFFRSKKAVYRLAAVSAFASMGDSTAIDSLGRVLKEDPVTEVREAAAFALGQTGNYQALAPILAQFRADSSARVRGAMLEAAGKCGDSTTLKLIATAPPYPNADTLLNLGQAYAIYRFALRGIVSKEGTGKMIDFLGAATTAESVRSVAAHYLYRAKGVELKTYESTILTAYEREQKEEIRLFLVLGVAKLKSAAALNALSKALRTDKNYQLRCNVLRGLASHFPADSIKQLMQEGVKDLNPHVAFTAAEALTEHPNEPDAGLYLEWANAETRPRVKAQLYAATLKAVPPYRVQTKTMVNDALNKAYQAAKTDTEKSFYLQAMGNFAWNYRFLGDTFFPAKDSGKIASPILKTAAAEAITKIYTQPDFAAAFGTYAYSTKAELEVYLQRMIECGDVGVVAIAAPVLREPKYNLKAVYRDVIFMRNALNRLSLPRDIENWQELSKTVDYFTGGKTPPYNLKVNKPLDFITLWNGGKPLRAVVKTKRGDFTIRLHPKEAPGSVQNFITLAKAGYFNGKLVHRVVPNFVVQTGCSRGDGWGGAENTIRSEFTPLRYAQAGVVGMASAGKDTEGTQWFVTHAAAPHLDGRYTVFGNVESGMESVHLLEVGDVIEQVTIQ